MKPITNRPILLNLKLQRERVNFALPYSWEGEQAYYGFTLTHLYNRGKTRRCFARYAETGWFEVTRGVYNDLWLHVSLHSKSGSAALILPN